MDQRLGDRLRAEVDLYLHGTPVGDRLKTLSFYVDALEADLALTRRLGIEAAGRAGDAAGEADDLFEQNADLNRALNEALELLGEEEEAGSEYEQGYLSELEGQREW